MRHTTCLFPEHILCYQFTIKVGAFSCQAWPLYSICPSTVLCQGISWTLFIHVHLSGAHTQTKKNHGSDSLFFLYSTASKLSQAADCSAIGRTRNPRPAESALFAIQKVAFFLSLVQTWPSVEEIEKDVRKKGGVPVDYQKGVLLIFVCVCVGKWYIKEARACRTMIHVAERWQT